MQQTIIDFPEGEILTRENIIALRRAGYPSAAEQYFHHRLLLRRRLGVQGDDVLPYITYNSDFK